MINVLVKDIKLHGRASRSTNDQQLIDIGCIGWPQYGAAKSRT